MAIRIVGVDLPQNKRGEIALTYVYGIGRSSSAKILDKAGVDRDVKVKDWTDEFKLQKYVKSLALSTRLKVTFVQKFS